MIQVASYCRVSTDKSDQANSFEAQQRFFREYIERQSDWTLYEVYADEGITGTSTKKRAAFNKMIQDAHLGRFQLIITKEVSRFSRNILDTIAYTRELRQLGVGVIFMNDGIHTLDPDAELRLSIMGSIAQEESRKTSTRVKWGQTRQMERGVVFGQSLLGYTVKDGQMTVNPEEAELIRLIFQKYGIEKKGTTVIARELREAGYRTFKGNSKWSNSHIIKILKNEKYVGDLVQKKTFTPDYLTHAKKYNNGEETLIVIQNHHVPIVDRALWDLVQSEIQKRNRHGQLSAGHSNRYVFSGKLKCGECGASFVSRREKRKDGSSYRRWSCRTAVTEGRRRCDAQGNDIGCNVGKTIRDETAMDILKNTLTSLKLDRKKIIQNVTEIAMDSICAGRQDGSDSAGQLEYKIEQLMQKKEAVLNAYFSKTISKQDMQIMNERYNRELEALQMRLDTARSEGPAAHKAEALREHIRQHVAAIVNDAKAGDVFYKNILDSMVIRRDLQIEVRLHLLPQTWIFVLERRCGSNSLAQPNVCGRDLSSIPPIPNQDTTIP